MSTDMSDALKLLTDLLPFILTIAVFSMIIGLIKKMTGKLGGGD